MAKGDKLDISTIKKYLASGTFAARFVTNKDINNEHGEGVSTLMNILVDESLSFMPFIKLPVFPADEDAREDIFYIIDDELYIFEAPDTWIQLVGGGGSVEKSHQFVEALPTNPKNNVEYIIMKDIADCSSFTGSFVWNSNANCWVNTSGAGQGVNDKYTFEKTSTGWIAKKNGTTIFTYSDQRIIQNQVDIKDIQNDIYGDYLVNRIEVCPNTPLVLTVDDTDPKKKKIKLCLSGDLGDKSDGAYEIKGQLSTFLSTALLGTTPVHASNVPDLDTNNIVIGETYLYDHQGTLAVVVDYDQSTDILTATTMTTSPGERSGVRLGAVEEQTDLPTTLAAATALGLLTPVEGDFAYVRKDGPNRDKLAEYLVQSIDNSGNITWAFSHYINAGNYVVDINLSDGTLIPKNPDGTVTLPNYVKKVELDDGTILSVDAQGKVTLPDFCELKGVRTSDGTLLTIAADKTVTLPEIPEKFNTYKIETTLEEWLDAKTDVDTLQDIDPAKLVDIIKKGSSMTISDFSLDVTPNRDLIYVHGKDRNSNTTQEAIAWFVSYSATTGIKLRILAIPGQGNSSSNGDKEVPEYTRNLYAGDKINHLELITYDNVLYRMIDTSSYTLTGNWVIDKTHFEVINSEAKNTYYNLNREGREQGSIQCNFNETQISSAHNTDIVFGMTLKSADGMEMVGANGIRLEAGKRYQIDTFMTTQDVSGSGTVTDMYYDLWDDTNNVKIAQVMLVDRSDSKLFGAGVASNQYTVPDTGDIVLRVKMPKSAQYNSANAKIRGGGLSGITVQEIGRVVDPIAYMLNDGNAQEMPVGSLIQTMSNSAPKHYLICDGSEYAIGTYPELEAHFLKEFGAVNHFGGANGKWKVPDLRGEFLRMTGTNSHINTRTGLKEGNGADVGAHQEASVLPQTWSGTGANVVPINYTENMKKSADTLKPFSKAGTNSWDTTNSYGGTAGAQTVRPTNTSVNVAIKCESTPRVIVDQGTYKASVKCSVAAAPSGGSAQFRFDGSDIIGDTTMVDTTTNEFIAPVDGMYVVGCQITTSGTGAVSNYLRINGAHTCWGRGINPMGTVYLKTGDRVSLNMYGGSNAQTGRANIALVNTVEKNIAEVMMKPNTWAVGVEQNFGDGVYGIRYTGTIENTTAGVRAQKTIDTTHSTSNTVMINRGGALDRSANGGFCLAPGDTLFGSTDKFNTPGGTVHFEFNVTKSGVVLGYVDSGAPYTRPYDVWMLYRKI